MNEILEHALRKIQDQNVSADTKYVEYQTWPFGDLEPKIYSKGVVNIDDFMIDILPAFQDIGVNVFWREVSLQDQ